MPNIANDLPPLPPESERKLRRLIQPDVEVSSDLIEVREDVCLRVTRFLPRTPTTTLPILLVPGYVAAMYNWRHFISRITRDVELIYLETREKASARLPRGASFGISEIGGDIAGAIEALQLADRKYALVASSLSATAILANASLFTRKPAAITLVLPNVNFRRIPWYGPFMLRFVPEVFLYRFVKVAEKYILAFRIKKSDVGLRERFMAAVSEADAVRVTKTAIAVQRFTLPLDSLPAIDWPALVIGAKNDPMHDQEGVKLIADSLPNSSFRELRTFTASHSKEAAEEVLRFLGRFQS